MEKKKVAFLTFIYFLSLSALASGAVKTINTINFDGVDFMTYTLNNNSTMTITLYGVNPGWFAVGFNTVAKSTMDGADIVRCWVDSTSKKIDCALYKGKTGADFHTQPTLDTTTTIQVLDGLFFTTNNINTWEVKFILPYASGGIIDTGIKNSEKLYVLYAYGTAMETKETFTKHSKSGATTTTLTMTYDCYSECYDCNGPNQNDCINKNKMFLYPSSTFSVYYSLVSIGSYPRKLRLQVKGKNSGYVLIGFGKQDFLPGTDALLINYTANGVAACYDVKMDLDGYGTLLYDTKNDCYVESYTKRSAQNDMDITVVRRLSTGDPDDFILNYYTKCDFAISYGPNDNFDYVRQVYSLQQFLLDTSRVCDFYCETCTGPDQDQCIYCQFQSNPPCLSTINSWENSVIINENYTLYYSVNDPQISFRIQGKPTTYNWIGIGFGTSLSKTNVLLSMGNMDFSSKKTIQGTREFDCISFQAVDSTSTLIPYSGESIRCDNLGNTYTDPNGINHYFIRPLKKVNSLEYDLVLGNKQNWLLVFGDLNIVDKTIFPKTWVPIPEFTLSGVKLDCPCTECLNGNCVKCPAGKQIFNNSCVGEKSGAWNYFTLPAPDPIEAAYTIWLPHNGTNFLSSNVGYIQFNFTGKKLGWIGMGNGTSMKSSDMFAIHKNINGDKWTCTDMISNSSTRPKFDDWLMFGQNNCEFISQDVSNDGYEVSIRRPLRAFDAYDSSISNTVSNYWVTPFIWAINNATEYLSYHGDQTSKQRGVLTLNITTNQICHASCTKGCGGPLLNDCYTDDPCDNLPKISVDGKFNISYYITNDTIIFRAKGPSKGWFGFGFSGGMVNVDMFVISFGTDGKPICTDYWSTGLVEPKSDVSLGGTNDCTVISGSRSSLGIIDVWFYRPIKATDAKYDWDFTNYSAEQEYGFAFGDSDVFKQHTSYVEKDISLRKINCTSEGCNKCPQIQKYICTSLNKISLTSNFSLYYQVCQGDVIFRAYGTSNGWFGLAFGKSMTNVDMLMINFTNSVANCYDLWSTGPVMPKFDTELGGTNDCKIINGTRDSKGVIDVWFRRPVMGTNANSDTEFKFGSQIDLSFAFGSSDVFTQHQSEGSSIFSLGSAQVCSSSCNTCSGPDSNNCQTCKSGLTLNTSTGSCDSSSSSSGNTTSNTSTNTSGNGSEKTNLSMILILITLLLIVLNH